MFRPFGCRATDFIGEKKQNLEHHKLAPRGEACIYLGLGYTRGYKGYICYNPENQKLYCTRNVVFDETFMPGRATDQRVLRHYDSTPRVQFPTMIHCFYQKAEEAFDKINKLALVSTLKMIEEIDPVDATAMKGPPCARTEHPEADGFIIPTYEATMTLASS
jgi:hypothetical protein